jgi:hypothetical protein
MCPELDASAIRVYAVLSKHANRVRHAFPGIRLIADEACCSTSTARRSLNDLEAVGAIQITRDFAGKRHKVNTYYLPMNRVATMTTPHVATIATPVATMNTPDVATIATELDFKNQRTREDDFTIELDLQAKSPRLPGESPTAYFKRLAELP